MSFVFRHKMQRTRGEGFVERDDRVDETTVTVGRGADCSLCLNDPRVLLEHLTLEIRDGEVFARSADAEEIRVDSQSIPSATLIVGNVLEVGPYELRVLDISDDAAIIEVELVSQLSDAEADLRQRTRIGIERIGLSVRGWTWSAVVLMLIIGAALPIGAYLGGDDDASSKVGMASHPGADRFFSPGPLSKGHAAFNESCSHCHEKPFQRVANNACLTCHTTLTAHADPAVTPMLALDAQPCTACHTEHVGSSFPLKNRLASTACGDCHGDLKAVSPKSTVASVVSFSEHPEFRATLPVMSDPGKLVRQARLDEPGGRLDGSGLKFPHKKHLNPAGVRGRDGTKKVLECASCHTQDAVTGVISTASFNQQCRSCHVLSFSPESPDKSLPHGDVDAARAMIKDHFAALALYGAETGTSQIEGISRRLPGEPLSEKERETALAWASGRAEETLSGPLGKGLCGGCHVLVEGSNPSDWTIAAISPPDRWLPHARFNHDPHVITACTTCHNAPESDQGSDLLMPSVKTCQTCHSDDEGPGQVAMACGSCHDFHGFSQKGREQASAQ